MSPTRTCVGCRGTDDRDDLVRLALHPDSGVLVVDLRARLPGRGAWVHARRECVAAIEARPKTLQRSLGSVPSTAGLADQLRARIEEAVLDGLTLAAAAGALVGGHDVLAAALREGQVTEVIVASDAAARTLKSLREASPEGTPFVGIPLTRDELGARIGRGARAALGVTRSRAASHLNRQLRRLEKLG